MSQGVKQEPSKQRRWQLIDKADKNVLSVPYCLGSFLPILFSSVDTFSGSPSWILSPLESLWKFHFFCPVAAQLLVCPETCFSALLLFALSSSACSNPHIGNFPISTDSQEPTSKRPRVKVGEKQKQLRSF